MSKDRSGETLQGEDKRLWKRVEASAKPLSHQARNLAADLASMLDIQPIAKQKLPPVFKNHKKRELPVQNSAPVTPQKPANPPATLNFSANPIEKPILKKLAKGKLAINARIDLHGMTQDRAKSALLDFLQLSYAADHRIVLVITGKGNAGTGILRQRVPDWLRLAPFSGLVNGVREAHVSHGGEGALYVRLRRNKNRLYGNSK